MLLRKPASSFAPGPRTPKGEAVVRATGDVIALAPPLIVSKAQNDDLIAIFARALTTVAD